MSKQSYFKKIRFSISTQISSIWPIEKTLSGAITLDQSGAGGNGNKWVLSLSQSSSITGTSPSDCLASYPGDSGGKGLIIHPLLFCRGVCPNWLDNMANLKHTLPMLNKYLLSRTDLTARCWWRYIYIYIYIYIFTNPSAQAGYDTRSIFLSEV